jgi:hypothetical protein
MKDEGKNYLYELKTPIKYANKGTEAEAEFIELRPPCAKNMTECSRLKQFFFRALPKEQEHHEADNKQEDKIDAAAIMAILSMSNDVDLDQVMVTGLQLFTSGTVAFVDGETKLTKPLVDAMSMDDFHDMLGEYLVNFVLASSLNKVKNL